MVQVLLSWIFWRRATSLVLTVPSRGRTDVRLDACSCLPRRLLLLSRRSLPVRARRCEEREDGTSRSARCFNLCIRFPFAGYFLLSCISSSFPLWGIIVSVVV